MRTGKAEHWHSTAPKTQNKKQKTGRFIHEKACKKGFIVKDVTQKKVLVHYTIRPLTIKALREHSKKVDLSMSHIVDMAIELYIREYIKIDFVKGR